MFPKKLVFADLSKSALQGPIGFAYNPRLTENRQIILTGVLMNKMKTHKGTKKRFRLTATGKVKHRASGKSHRNVRMSAKRTRNLRGGNAYLDECMIKSIVKALGKYSY